MAPQMEHCGRCGRDIRLQEWAIHVDSHVREDRRAQGEIERLRRPVLPVRVTGYSEKTKGTQGAY